MNRWIWLIVTLLLLGIRFIPAPEVNLQRFKHPWESFDSSLAERITSMNLLQREIGQRALQANISEHQLGYYHIAASVLRDRFAHGYSYYGWHDNWIACLSARLLNKDWNAIVLPDDILKHPTAACSQQELVLIELFRQDGVPYRKILFNHHFAVEARIDSNWYFFDTDLEPHISLNTRLSLQEIMNRNLLPQLYQGRIPENQLDSLLGKPQYGNTNEYPAIRARRFQLISRFLSKWLWLLPLVLFLYSIKKPRMNTGL